MPEPRIVKDHIGNEHPSISAMCRVWGISRTAYDSRLRAGMPLEAILTTPVKSRPLRNKVHDPYGIEYESETEMCRHYGISRGTYRSRLDMGWSQEEALTAKPGKHFEVLDNPIVYNNAEYWSYTSLSKDIDVIDKTIKTCIEKGFTIDEIIYWTKKKVRMIELVTDHLGNRWPSLSYMCEHLGISLHLYHQGIKAGLTLEEILNRDVVYDHKGNKYASLQDMCQHYGLSVSCYKNRLNRGWTQEDALTLPFNATERDVYRRTDIDGTVYKSIDELCQKYSINPSSYLSRLNKGWDKKRALILPISEYQSTRYSPDELILNGIVYSSLTQLCKQMKMNAEYVRHMKSAGFTNDEIFELGPGVNPKKVVRDHTGKLYRSEKAMCAAYGICQSVYRHRRNNGMTIEEALTYKTVIEDPAGNKFDTFNDLLRYHGIELSTGTGRRRNGWTIKEIIAGKKDTEAAAIVDGQEYLTLANLCENIGISRCALDTRLKKGMTAQEAVDDYRKKKADKVYDHLGNEFDSESEMCKYHKIAVTTYHCRRSNGCSIEEALQPVSKKIKDHLGNEYSCLSDMLNKYGIKYSCWIRRKKAGWTVKDILTTPPRPVSIDYSGEEKVMHCGLKLKLVHKTKACVYIGMFEDGTTVNNVLYSSFAKESIKHPQLSKNKVFCGFKVNRKVATTEGNVYYECQKLDNNKKMVMTPYQMMEHSKICKN